MGFFDSLEKQVKMKQYKSVISHSQKLFSEYDKTDDPATKRAITQQLKDNKEILDNLKYW